MSVQPAHPAVWQGGWPVVVLSEHLLFELICQVLSEGLKLFSPAQTKSFEHWLPPDSVPLCTEQQMCLTGSLTVPEIFVSQVQMQFNYTTNS